LKEPQNICLIISRNPIHGKKHYQGKPRVNCEYLTVLEIFFVDIRIKNSIYSCLFIAISRCDDVSVIPINIWWQSEVPRAQAYSTLLKVDRASRTTTTNKALRYLTPSYKSYIKVLVEHKRITRKDLKRIDTRSDLTTHEKKVAFDLYWLIHMKFPKLTFGLYASEIEYWNPDRQRYLFPDDLQHLADHKPLFIWYASNSCIII
jgi:hypothetical protein